MRFVYSSREYPCFDWKNEVENISSEKETELDVFYQKMEQEKEELLSSIKANNKKKETNDIESSFGEKLINIAREKLGHPYDTSSNGMDGGALEEWEKTGKCSVKNNLTGEISISNKRPFVCTDLIVESLSQIGTQDSVSVPGQDPFDRRRIAKVEKSLEKASDAFSVINCDFSVKFPENKINGPLSCLVGDIITISNNKNGGRHVGIVTDVDANGIPSTVIHSSGYRGVVETPFLNSSEIKDYKNKTRYDGFLYGDVTINKIIRPRVA